MKKLFISCPMKGRTEENIRKSMEKMHRIAEIVFDQELEVIDSYMPEAAPVELNNKRIWYLGKSIQMLSKADYFIGVDWNDVFKGCNLEHEIANIYGIKNITVNMHDLMPDLRKVINDYYESMQKNCEPMSM